MPLAKFIVDYSGPNIKAEVTLLCRAAVQNDKHVISWAYRPVQFQNYRQLQDMLSNFFANGWLKYSGWPDGFQKFTIMPTGTYHESVDFLVASAGKENSPQTLETLLHEVCLRYQQEIPQLIRPPETLSSWFGFSL